MVLTAVGEYSKVEKKVREVIDVGMKEPYMKGWFMF